MRLGLREYQIGVLALDVGEIVVVDDEKSVGLSRVVGPGVEPGGGAGVRSVGVDGDGAGIRMDVTGEGEKEKDEETTEMAPEEGG